LAEVLKTKNNMADKPTSASTDDKKFEDMTLIEKVRAAAQKVKEEKEKRKRDAAKPFNPDIGDASTDDPKPRFPKPISTSSGGDEATETIKPDSAVQMKRRSDGSMAKLKDQSFMKRMKMMNEASPTKLIEGEHDSVFDILKNKPIGTTKKQRDKIKNISKTIYDKIKTTGILDRSIFNRPGIISDELEEKIRKSKKIPSTPPYAPPKIGGGTIGGGIGTTSGKSQLERVFHLTPLGALYRGGKAVATKYGKTLSDLFGK